MLHMQGNSESRFGRPRILIVGCGDVGRRLLPELTKTHQVIVLTSQASKLSEFRALGAVPVLGNLDQRHTLTRLSTLASTVIHLAPPNPEGLRDLRTQNLLRILSQGGRVRRFVYVSTTGVYGHCAGDWVSESDPVNPRTSRAKRRVDAENQIRAWAVASQVTASILRVPGIYAGNRLPIDRLKQGTPALLPEEDVFTNHIHADDLAGLILMSIYRGRPQRLINTSDDSYLKMGEYFDLVARYTKLPKAPRVSFEELREAVSPMMLSFMQESRRVRNQRMSELGYELQYPSVEDFLKAHYAS